MNDEVVSWLLAVEFSLPFIVLSIVLGFFLISNQRKNKEAARNLILKIKNSEEGEKQAIFDFLKGKLSYDEDLAKQSSKKIINERKFLFRNLISGLLDKNVEAIESLNSDLSRIANLYHTVDLSHLKSDEPAEESEQESEAEDDSLSQQAEAVAQQRREIKTLKQEVHITLTTLNNIFAEFSSMFGEEVPDSEMSVDQIITAMESFSGKKPTTDAVEDIAGDSMVDLTEDEPDTFAEVDTGLDETQSGVTADPKNAQETQDHSNKSEAGLTGVNSETGGKDKAGMDFSLDNELDDIDKALEDLELGSSGESEPSWDEAFEESGDKKSDEN